MNNFIIVIIIFLRFQGIHFDMIVQSPPPPLVASIRVASQSQRMNDVVAC